MWCPSKRGRKTNARSFHQLCSHTEARAQALVHESKQLDLKTNLKIVLWSNLKANRHNLHLKPCAVSAWGYVGNDFDMKPLQKIVEGKHGCSLAQEFDACDITDARKNTKFKEGLPKYHSDLGLTGLTLGPAGYELEELRPIHKPSASGTLRSPAGLLWPPSQVGCFDFVLEIIYLVLKGSPLLLKLKASPDRIWTSCTEMGEQELPTWAAYKTPCSSYLQIADLPKVNSFHLQSPKPGEANCLPEIRA